MRFDPSIGAEMRAASSSCRKSRFALVDCRLRIVVLLRRLATNVCGIALVCASSRNRTSGLAKDSGADAFQVKSVSANRFVQRIGKVSLMIDWTKSRPADRRAR